MQLHLEWKLKNVSLAMNIIVSQNANYRELFDYKTKLCRNYTFHRECKYVHVKDL